MNQYQSIIHAGALKYLKSDKVKDKLGQLHNTFLRYMQTSVNYERELKQAFMPFLTSEHPEIVAGKKSKCHQLRHLRQHVAQRNLQRQTL